MRHTQLFMDVTDALRAIYAKAKNPPKSVAITDPELFALSVAIAPYLHTHMTPQDQKAVGMNEKRLIRFVKTGLRDTVREAIRKEVRSVLKELLAEAGIDVPEKAKEKKVRVKRKIRRKRPGNSDAE